MPRIPLPSFVRPASVEPSITAPAVPSIDWQTEAPRAIADHGLLLTRTVSEVADIISRNYRSSAHAEAEFTRMKTATDDRILAARDRAIIADYNSQAKTYLAENVNAPDEQKMKELKRLDSDMRFQRKATLSKMSPDGRRLYTAETAPVINRNRAELTETIRQAAVTRRYNLSLAQVDQASAVGDYARARRIVESQTGLLFSREQAEKMKIGIDAKEQYALAGRGMDGDFGSVSESLGKLTAKHADTQVYVNYDKLSVDDRNNLIRVGNARLDAIDRDTETIFLRGLAAGEVKLNEDQIDGGVGSHWSAGAALRMRTALNTFRSQQAAAAERETARAQQAAAEASAAEKAARAEAERKLKEETDRQEAAFKWRLSQTVFSADSRFIMSPDGRWVEGGKDSLKAEASRLFPGDYNRLLRLNAEIDSAAAGETAPEFKTPAGKQVLSYLQAKYRDDAGTYRGLKWDPWGLEKENSQEFMQARFYEILDIARQKLAHGSAPGEVLTSIDDAVSELNAGNIKTLLERQLALPAASAKAVTTAPAQSNPAAPAKAVTTAPAQSNSAAPVEGQTGRRASDGAPVVYRNGAWRLVK